MKSARSLFWGVVGAMSLGGVALGQGGKLQPPIAPEPKQTMNFGQLYQTAKDVQENRRAGVRSMMLAQSMQVVPVVVVVKSERAYLEAIAMWEGQIRFPVLFDDGSDVAREHIARFVRAFEPERVISMKGSDVFWWGEDRAKRKEVIERVFAMSVQQNSVDWRETFSAIKRSGIVSPGVVVMDPSDSHWAGGLALAAGRLQHIVFVSGPNDAWRDVEKKDAIAMNSAIGLGLRQLGLKYDEIGDDIDGVTLAVRMGARVKVGSGSRDVMATTDFIGRSDDASGGERWAWSGQLVGSMSETVYQSMSALFLEMDTGFVWDGYPAEGDWEKYDGSETADVLRGGGWETELFDTPRNTLSSFRGRGDSRSVDASLILMNSKGSSTYFDLPGAAAGSGRPGDLPMLGEPSALHMVHSFSLMQPMNRDSVGGRWLDRGVYLYAGSVDEPYLTGFVPTPMVAKRLLGTMPFAGAVHYDDSPMWKIAVIGDPLKTVGACGNRMDLKMSGVNEAFEKLGATMIEARAKKLLKDGEYNASMRDFALVGRDDAVVRLGKVLLRDKPEEVDDEGAKVIMSCALRLGERELVFDAFERLGAEARGEKMVLDVLWFAGRFRVLRFDDVRALALLRTNLRPNQIIHDAEQVAMYMRRSSLSDALGFMDSVRTKIQSHEYGLLNQAKDRVRK